ncbi:MAG: FAD-dependent oxidoreductase [Verrucomicrobia bacterium]|nr:FAD-dependent oxidoreductase [Verrucomicrobiota bacterium]
MNAPVDPSPFPKTPLPPAAKIVILGGGVAGASAAYHLALRGCTDVVLLEQSRVGGGTSWHAAGMVGRLRTTTSMTRINQASADLYARIHRESGHDVGWKQVGSVIVAKSKDRMIQLQRTCAMAELMGVEATMISAQEARERWPLIRIDDLLGAAWLPHDGKVIPKEVPVALAKAAARMGAKIIEGARAIALVTRKDTVIGVETNQGLIHAERVVIAGGMWSRDLALRSGVNLPLYPVEHHYVVSEPIEGAFDELPLGRDPDLCIYFRGEGQSVMLGAFQKFTKPWMVDRIPDDFSFKLLEPDWEKFDEPLKHGAWRIPALEKSRYARFVNGPESFTPDNQFLIGETPELKNLFVCAGFNSAGIATAGGAGNYLAEWILDGEPSIDLWSVDIRRFGPWANNRSFLRTRVTETLGLHYQMAWPNREFETGRGVRRSALHSILAGQGAVFGVKAGWERPNVFAPPGEKAELDYTFGRPHWFPWHAAEHLAARQSAALFDQSGFSKFHCSGQDALPLLEHLCGNKIDVPPGRIVYTGMFNQHGGFESDLTLFRESESSFYLISGTSQAVRDAHWIRKNALAYPNFKLSNVTNAFGVLGLMGPHSRKILSAVTNAELDHESFPFGTGKLIDLGHVSALALRITYVGELGWELHVPVEQMASAYEALMVAGAPWGLRNAGHYAINSLRLEKGFRAWGAELSPWDTPIEAGLQFAIDWNKPFLGRVALLQKRSLPRTKALVLLTLKDPEAMLWGSEPVLCQGKPVGYTLSGAYGHTVGRSVATAYVPLHPSAHPQDPLPGPYAINLNGEMKEAEAHLKPLYDPKRERVTAQ